MIAIMGKRRPAKKVDTPAEEVVMELPLNWGDGGLAAFANNLVVQTDNNGCLYLSFYQVLPPLLVGTQAQRKEQASEIKSVKAMPVAKIAVTPDRFMKMLEVLNKHGQNLLASIKKNVDNNGKTASK
jgi:hypothetical protein